MSSSSTSPPAPQAGDPAGAGPAPRSGTGGRLGAGETAVIITAITAVTVLGVLQRPVPAALAALAGAACLLALPSRSVTAGRAAGVLGRLVRLLAVAGQLTGNTTGHRTGTDRDDAP
jgi:hypothetical protein